MIAVAAEDELLLDLDLLDGVLIEFDLSRIVVGQELAWRGVLSVEMGALGGRVWARFRRANGVRIEDLA